MQHEKRRARRTLLATGVCVKWGRLPSIRVQLCCTRLELCLSVSYFTVSARAVSVRGRVNARAVSVRGGCGHGLGACPGPRTRISPGARRSSRALPRSRAGVVAAAAQDGDHRVALLLSLHLPHLLLHLLLEHPPTTTPSSSSSRETKGARAPG